MTGARYGFSSDFQIVDRMGDLPRDAKTLSGGETFLASLALALGLLEVAGRGGGRLDALFLDEGFASLDGGAIDEALSELERVAGRGRLVAVVSHLKAVAERIDDVLYVHRQPGDRSSVAEWIGPEERDALVMRDVELTLLA
jgi:exonuclease SbcC